MHIELNPNLMTGLAWDNYDVNIDTLDGKDTLHATVRICYQNIAKVAVGFPLTAITNKNQSFVG